MAFPRSGSVKQLAANLFEDDMADRGAEDNVSTSAESEPEGAWPSCGALSFSDLVPKDGRFVRSVSDASTQPPPSRAFSRQASWDDSEVFPSLPVTKLCRDLPGEVIAVGRDGVCEFMPALACAKAPSDADHGFFAVGPDGVAHFVGYAQCTDEDEVEHTVSEAVDCDHGVFAVFRDGSTRFVPHAAGDEQVMSVQCDRGVFGVMRDGPTRFFPSSEDEGAMSVDCDHGAFAVFRDGSSRFVPYAQDESDDSEDDEHVVATARGRGFWMAQGSGSTRFTPYAQDDLEAADNCESDPLGSEAEESDSTDDDEASGWYAVGRDGVAQFVAVVSSQNGIWRSVDDMEGAEEDTDHC